jgi:hypothetical protein
MIAKVFLGELCVFARENNFFHALPVWDLVSLGYYSLVASLP